MSASAIAAPPDTGSMSMDQELGATLTEALETVTGGETTPDPAAEPALATAEEAPPGEAGNGPSQPSAPPMDTPPGEAGSAAYQLTPDGAAYMVPKTELPVLQGFKQYAESVQNRFPTANDAELGYLEQSDFRALRSDFLSGDPKNIDAVLGYFSGKDHTDPALAGQFRDSFLRMAERLPETLKGINPEAHAKLGDSFINSRIEAAYARAAESGNPDDLLAAQRIDWGHTGQYKTELPKHDPQAAAQAALAKERQDIDSRREGLLNRDWTSFNKTSLEGPKWAAFNAEVDRVLAPVKEAYDPVVFDALREKISKQALGKIQEDFEWARNHNNDLAQIQAQYNQLWKAQRPSDGLKPRIQTFTNDFMTRVRRHLPAIAQPLLEKAPAKRAGVNQQPKPQAAPQQPGRAANGQFQPAAPPNKGKTFYNIQEDPEFLGAFKVQ